MSKNTSVYVPKHLTPDTKIGEYHKGDKVTAIYAKDCYSTEDHAIKDLKKWAFEFEHVKGAFYCASLDVNYTFFSVSGIFDLIGLKLDEENKEMELIVLADSDADGLPEEALKLSPLSFKFKFTTVCEEFDSEMHDYCYYFALPDGGEVEFGISAPM